MSEAVFRVRTEGGPELARLLADAERLMDAARRRTAAGERQQRARRDEEQRHYRQSAAATGEAIVRSDQLVTRQRLRQLAQTDEARRRSETLYAMMVNRATAALEREVGKRGELTERERRQVHQLAQAMMVEHERAERAKTAATQREAQRRAQIGREVQGRVAGALMQAGAAAMSAGRDIHGAIQDSRERRAASQHTLNAAFFQAGVGGQEAGAMRQLLDRELTQGSLRGLRSEDVAGALNAAQTQFSVLSGANAGARMQALQRQVELMSFARNTYQDPGEVLRVAGMLNQQGIRGEDQRAVLMRLTGMAQAGAVELSTLTSTALGPLMQNIARSVSSSMTPQQRAAAVTGALEESMAVGQIGAAAGLTPRDALNALAKTRGSVESERTQGVLYDRLRSSGRQDLADQLFRREGDRNVLRDRSAVGLLSALVRGFGGDTNAVTNLLAAGGPGAPMVLDAQQRRLIQAMASQTQSGGTIADNVARMRATGSDFTEARVAAGAAMVDAEAQTALNASREQRDSALTDNTSALVRLSDQLRDFLTANPIAGAAVSGVTGVGGAMAGSLLARAGGGAAGSAAAATAGAGAGGWLAGGAAALVGGLALGEGINRLIYNDRERAQGDTSILSAETWRNFATAVGQTFGDSLRSNPPQVTVDAAAAAHAATLATARTAQ